jgi:hypothetical protein
MLLWALLVFAAIFSVARFKPLQKHVGTGQAIVVLALRLIAVAAAALLLLPISVSSARKVHQPARIAILVDASRSTNTPARREVVKSLKQSLRHRPVLIWEFSENLRPVSLLNLSEVAEGNASRLSAAIRTIVASIQPDELLVVTDGQDTEPQTDKQLLEELRKGKTRVSVVLLPTSVPPNLRLTVSPTQATLFAGERISFAVKVEGTRLHSKTSVQVRVWEARKLVSQATLKIANGAAQTTVTLTPSGAGWHRYRFEVLPAPNEVWTEDNSADAMVWQAPTKLRVLLATGQPNFEFKFAKQAIEEEPNFEWVAVSGLPDGTRYQQGSPKLLPASLQKLDPFHVVAIIAPTPDQFGAAEGRAVWHFAQNGGGLLVTLNELSVRSNGWRFFVPEPLKIVPLPAPANLRPERGDLLGEKLTNLLATDAAWAVRPQRKAFRVALQVGNEPVLVWWQEGWGKVAILGLDGTWRWAMEAARKGGEPKIHRQFWQTLIRFLADPTKGRTDEISKVASELKTPSPPPPELTVEPTPDLLRELAKATGGQILQPHGIAAWTKGLKWTKSVTVPTSQPLSQMPLPYLLLLLALTAEWWLTRRSGLP